VKNVGNDKVSNLPHTFSSFQSVARDMNDSSENMGQDAIPKYLLKFFINVLRGYAA